MQVENTKESIFSGILTYSISTWANLIIGFLSVIVSTRIVEPDTYGEITIFLSATSVMMYVMTLGMDSAYLRFYNDPPKNHTKNQLLYMNMLISTLVVAILTIICITLFGTKLSLYIFGFNNKRILILLFLYTWCQILLRYLNITFRMGFQVRKYTVQNILMNCLTRILIICAAIISNEFGFIVSVVTLGTTLVLLIYCFIQRDSYIPYNSQGVIVWPLKIKGYGEYFRFALFSAPTYIVTYLNTFVQQQTIRSLLSAYDLGIFSSTSMFSSILSAVKGGFSTFWSAYVYKNYEYEKEKIVKMHDYIMFFSIFMSSGLVIAKDVVYLFIGKEYHSSKNFFSLLLFMPILSFVMETTDKGIALSKKNEINLVTHVIAVLCNLLFCRLLIPVCGIHGAAYANAISAVVLYALNTMLGQKYYRSIARFSKSVLGIMVIILILLVPVWIETNGAIISLVLVVDCVAIFIFRKEFLEICKMIYIKYIKR